MEDSALAAIATYVMRDQQQLGCLRIRDGVVTLEKMYFADEIRPIDEIRADAARRLEERARDGRAADRALHRLLPARAVRGHLPRRAPRRHQGEAQGRGGARRAAGAAGAHPDLLAALRASLEAAGGPRKNGKRRNGLGTLSKQELYERAKKADISGRADMSKEELIEALEAA